MSSFLRSSQLRMRGCAKDGEGEPLDIHGLPVVSPRDIEHDKVVD